MGDHYYFIVPLIVGVILVAIAVLTFFFSKEAEPRFWVWLFFFVGIFITILGVIVYTAAHANTALSAGNYYYYRHDLDLESAAVDYPRYNGPLIVIPPPPCQPCVPCVAACPTAC